MMNKKEAYMMLDRILNWAGDFDMKVLLRGVSNGLTRFAGSEIHQNIFQEDLEVEIEISKGRRRAEAKTNRLEEEELRSTIKQLRKDLEHSPEREYELPLIDGPEEISCEESDDRLPEKLDVAGRAELISSGIDSLPAGFSAAGSLALEEGFIALGNTAGIRRYARRDMGSFNTVISDKENEGSGYAELQSETADDLRIAEAFERAARKASDSSSPGTLPPGEYTVVLEPLAAADLLGYLAYTGFSGRSVQQGRSFLTGRIGEKIWGDNISIYDDCRHEKTMTLPFDMEGAERQPLTIIEEGVARDLAYDLASALEAGVETTGHSIGRESMGGFPLHLVMAGGEKTPEDLIAETDRGILVTRFHYMNVVNPRRAVLTGLTRDGTFLIEDGEIAEAIEDLRFTQDMMKSFNSVKALSEDRFKTPGLIGTSFVPWLKIEDFHFSGSTEKTEQDKLN